MKVQVTPLGHATCLIEIDSLRLITDPIFDAGTGLTRVFRIGMIRRRPPPIPIAQLPPIDAVLLSHAHIDHTDRYALSQMPASAVAICHERNQDLIERFADRRALAWGDSTRVVNADGVAARVRAIPAGHYGSRGMFDKWRGYGGYLIEVEGRPSSRGGGEALTLMFAGDTAQTDEYAKLRARRKGRGVDLAIMPIGGYKPWIHHHCSPEQAWSMAIRDLGAERILPMHYDVFPLSFEPVGEAMRRLHEAARAEDQGYRVVGTEIGAPCVVDW